MIVILIIIQMILITKMKDVNQLNIYVYVIMIQMIVMLNIIIVFVLMDLNKYFVNLKIINLIEVYNKCKNLLKII